MDSEANDKIAEVSKMIWDICKISPEHGNAVMDIIGYEAYNKIMHLNSEMKEDI